MEERDLIDRDFDESDPEFDTHRAILDERDELSAQRFNEFINTFGELSLINKDYFRDYVESIFTTTEINLDKLDGFDSTDLEEFIQDPNNEVPKTEINLFKSFRDEVMPRLLYEKFGIELIPDENDCFDFDMIWILYRWFHTQLRVTLNFFVSHRLLTQDKIVNEIEFFEESGPYKVKEYITHAEYVEILSEPNSCNFEEFVSAYDRIDSESVESSLMKQAIEENRIVSDQEVFFSRIQNLIQ